MFLNLLFTPKGEENAIICRKSHFSPLSPACAHLLIIFKCNHLPFCFQNHWDFTPFRAELGGKGLALNISQCLKVWNVITRQMKDCVFSCCHVGCGELSTSMDCLFLCWGYKAWLGVSVFYVTHTHWQLQTVVWRASEVSMTTGMEEMRATVGFCTSHTHCDTWVGPLCTS